MGLIARMEHNKDTAGWGLIGAVIAYAMSSHLIEQLSTAALVAGSGCLGHYIVKKIVTYLEGMITRWKENRKNKSNKE